MKVNSKLSSPSKRRTSRRKPKVASGRVVSRLANRKPLFWDVDPANIKVTLRENDDWVIVRIFQYGTLDDILDCIELYGKKKVTNVISTAKLRPMAYAMGHLFLGVDPQGKYS